MEEITIRNYLPEDWESIEEIHDEARKVELKLAGLDSAFIPLKQAAVNEGLFDYTLCVACEGANVVGFAAYSEDELAWLYVGVQWMRRGIGKKLAKYVIENTKKRPLSVEVLTGNTPAVGLYKSVGFKLIKTATGVMVGNDDFKISAYILHLD